MPVVSGNKIAVFASGFGSNLQSLIQAEHDGALKGTIRLVVSDRQEALALQRASQGGIAAVFVDPKKYANKAAFDQALLKLVQDHDISYVVLAGYMRILTEAFVTPLLGKIVNIHPSLLPAYPGMNAIERAYEAQEKEVGVTVHFVDQGVDTGPIILQNRLSVVKGESLQELTERVHALEHAMLVEAVNKVVAGEIILKERP